MEKKLKLVRQRELHNKNATFYDVYLLRKWVGEITTASAGHIFEIDLTFKEYKEE